jgi:RecJ-like exonuclease
MDCKKCGGTGRISVLNPVTKQPMGDKPCDLCEGTGFIPENVTDPEVLRRLDRIIELMQGGPAP